MSGDGLVLGFTADRWIAPGDQVSLDLASSKITVRRAGSDVDEAERDEVRDLIRVLAAVGARFSVLSSVDPRLEVAASGLVLVHGYVTGTPPVVVEGGELDVASEPVGGTSEAVDQTSPAVGGGEGAAPVEGAAPAAAPPEDPSDPRVTGRPRGMPDPDEECTCTSCGATIPPRDTAKGQAQSDAQFAWIRFRRILCRECLTAAAGGAKPAAADADDDGDDEAGDGDEERVDG